MGIYCDFLMAIAVKQGGANTIDYTPRSTYLITLSCSTQVIIIPRYLLVLINIYLTHYILFL